MSKIKIDEAMNTFFEDYFFFEEAAQLQEFVEFDNDVTIFMTDDGYDELVTLVDDLEEAVAHSLLAVKELLDK